MSVESDAELKGYIRAMKGAAERARRAANAPKCPADGPAALEMFAASIDRALAKFEAASH